MGPARQGTKLIDEFVERLQHQGYAVHTDDEAVLNGRSGATHSFDVVATRDDGFISFTLVADVPAPDEEAPLGLGTVFAFDDKCYDCGIRNKLLVVFGGLDEVAERFALNQRIKILTEEDLRAFVESAPEKSFPESKSLAGWDNKTRVFQSLASLGYGLKRNAVKKGRSGAEYKFDVIASLDDGIIEHQIAIDDLGDGEVPLHRVSVFDAKAYDTGMAEKVIMVRGELTDEARQFAKLQRIRVIRLSDEETEGPEEEEQRAEAGEEGEAGRDKDNESAIAPGDESEVPATRSNLQSAVEEILETKPPTERAIKSRPQTDAIQLVPESMARRFKAVPLTISEDALKVAMANPSDIFALEALGLQTRMRIDPIAASEREVLDAIDMNYRGFGQIEEQISRIPTGREKQDDESFMSAAEDTPVASALRLIIDEAAKARASDIHLEPQEDRLRVRYRVDGALQEVMSLPLKIHLPLTSRVKILADMNIADHLRPQDGQFSTDTKGREVDVRVATVPTVHGEATVMRLLDKSLGLIPLQGLGFSKEALSQYENMLKVAFGMILISGPTGSGKTTTLYASINQMDKTTQKIITIEDPVEYRFDNILQIQVNPKAGLTFAGGLRSILRLDPDTILVGEIRDGETSRIAVQSALTGHLVLSSIHANDALGVIFRLLDLGIEPFLVSSSVVGVVAQRMVRRLCPDCAVKREATLLEQLSYHNETGEHRSKFLYGEGCDLCGHSGYRGRIGLYEVLPISDKLRMLILKGASTTEVRQTALEEGMVPLMRDGMLKVKEGITTPSEVLRTAYSIE